MNAMATREHRYAQDFTRMALRHQLALVLKRARSDFRLYPATGAESILKAMGAYQFGIWCEARDHKPSNLTLLRLCTMAHEGMCKNRRRA